jgi:DNA topoisomerase-2
MKAPSSSAVEKQYRKLEGREHVLKRPDSYVGTLYVETKNMFIVDLQSVSPDGKTFAMVEKDIEYSQCLERIYLEILSNAADNGTRTKMQGLPQGAIKVEVGDDYVKVYNEGIPVPTQWHSEFETYIPTMIFFTLLTGSNFDDTKVRKWGGRNGYGAKLAAIFSKQYMVICHNALEGVEHAQCAMQNMSQVLEPERKQIKDKDNFTIVQFHPDFKRFYCPVDGEAAHPDDDNLTDNPLHCYKCWEKNEADSSHGHFDADMVGLFAALAFDFSFNNRLEIEFAFVSERLRIKKKILFDARNPVDYVKAFFPKMPDKPPIYFETADGDNRVMFLDTPHNGFQRSFANGIPTRDGGVHVNAWLNAIGEGLKRDVDKSGIRLNATTMKAHVTLFLSHYCDGPSFEGQTKEKLKGPIPKGVHLPKKLLEEFSTWEAYAQIKKNVTAKEKAKINSTFKPKKSQFIDIKHMDDAVMAGTDKAHLCAGVVCEGVSAKTFFTQGISAIKDGRERYGCLPVRGKILNTSKASTEKVLKSKVIEGLIQFFGLDVKLDYSVEKNRKRLRYGKAIILTDADVDGIHIKTLLLNFFASFTGLLESGFVESHLTPVVIATKGKSRLKFYSTGEYERWVKKTPDVHHWHIDYFKGLGSSSKELIRESFVAPVKQRITCGEEDKEILALVMNPDTGEERKNLYRMLHKKPDEMRMDSTRISGIRDIVYEELIQFAIAANVRAIPSFFDGCKQSHRQVVFTLLNKKIGKMGVGEFQGLVKALTHYRHAPEAMNETIVGMGQNFPGSNNVELLEGHGQFGTRIGMGKDAAKARYIHCSPSPVLRFLFRPEDDILLIPILEEGEKICVREYYPIIPMQLINRCNGIGWGWSTDTPNYNPKQIVSWIKVYITHIKDGNARRAFKPPPLIPWWRGYKGVVFRKRKDGQLVSRGYFRMEGHNCHVLDLPVTVSGYQFEAFIDKLVAEGRVLGRKTLTVDTNRPRYMVYDLKEPITKHAGFLLEEGIRESNFVYLDEKNLPRQYVFGAEEFLAKWCAWRYGKYAERREKHVRKLQEDVKYLQMKVKFIHDVIAEPPRFDIRCKDAEYIKGYMRQNGFPKEFLQMAYNSFSQKRVDAIEKELKEKLDEIEYYKRVHPGDLWLRELEEFTAKLEELHPGEWEFYEGYGTRGMEMPE